MRFTISVLMHLNVLSLPLFLWWCCCSNIPFEFLAVEKAKQKWVERDGDKFLFKGGGSTFPNGVGTYLDQMQELIPGMANGTVRTVLDTGCGVSGRHARTMTGETKGQLAAYLLKHWRLC